NAPDPGGRWPEGPGIEAGARAQCRPSAGETSRRPRRYRTLQGAVAAPLRAGGAGGRRPARQSGRVRAAPQQAARGAGNGAFRLMKRFPGPVASRSRVSGTRAERVRLAGPAGDIEALVETSADMAADGGVAQRFGVVCHPHPLYGGTLDNKVVYTLARAFVELGVPSIRFNFRGVGGSAGGYDEGRGETADALAVIAYGRDRWPGAALWLAGFSFGGVIALRAAAPSKPQRLVAVAPGVTRVAMDGV